MKFKLSILASVILFLTVSMSHAQFITLARSPGFPISQTVGLTRPGPLTVIWSGNIQWAQAAAAALIIDGAGVDTYTIPGGTTPQYHSRTYRSAAQNPGNHSVQVNVTGNAPKTDAILLIIAESEPSAGVQEALNQLTTAFQTADTNLRTSLITQITAIQDALQTQITDLETRISVLEGNTPSQDPAIADLQAQITTLQQEKDALRTELLGLISGLNADIADLQARIAALEGSSPGEDPDPAIAELEAQIAALQQQLAALTASHAASQAEIQALQQQITALIASRDAMQAQMNAFQQELAALTVSRDALQTRVTALEQAPAPGGSSSTTTNVRTKKQGLKTTDYLIIGGSAAGATALGVGIYSLLDDDSGSSSEAVSTKNENRPGYRR